MTWSGMDKKTGRKLAELSHIRQSITDILTTPVGSRVMRRDYGSMLFELVDQPQSPAVNLKVMAATVIAIMTWEPRVVITSVNVRSKANGSEIDVSGYHQETAQEFTFEGVAPWR